jgi:hypothetical protein
VVEFLCENFRGFAPLHSFLHCAVFAQCSVQAALAASLVMKHLGFRNGKARE